MTGLIRERDAWARTVAEMKRVEAARPSIRFRLRLIGVAPKTWMRSDRRWVRALWGRAEDVVLVAMCWAFGHYFLPGGASGAVLPGVGVIGRRVEPPLCCFCLVLLPGGDLDALEQDDAL